MNDTTTPSLDSPPAVYAHATVVAQLHHALTIGRGFPSASPTLWAPEEEKTLKDKYYRLLLALPESFTGANNQPAQ